jgi:hypothetical protein
MHPKEVFWIGAKGGLCEEKHYRCMRDSVWLFLWLLVRQTGVNEAGEGIVNRGHPLTRTEIQTDTGYHERRVENWIDLLRRTGYVRTERSGNDGLIFFIQNAKDKSKRKAVQNPVGNGNSGEVRAKEESPNKGTLKAQESPKKGSRIPNGGDGKPNNHHKNAEVTQNTTIFTPKSLSYSNTDAAAKAAAGVSPLIDQVALQKQIPRQYISDEEARRRAEKQKQDLAKWMVEHGQAVTV